MGLQKEVPTVIVAGEEDRKLRGTGGKEVVPGALACLYCGARELRNVNTNDTAKVPTRVMLS